MTNTLENMPSISYTDFVRCVHLLTGAMQLENRTQQEGKPCLEGETDMARQKVKIMLGNGVPVWVTGTTTTELVQNAIDKFASQTPAKEQQTPTFEAIAQKWYDLRWKPKEKGKVNTWVNVKTMVFTHIIPYFKGRMIGDIKQSDVQAFLNAMRDEGRISSTSSLSKALLYLKQILDCAVDDDLIAKNPAGNKKKFDVEGTLEEREPLNAEQVSNLVADLERLPIQDALLVYIPLYTGARRGETLGFRWEDIDWKRKMISVKRAVHFRKGAPSIGEPKSKAGYREIPLRQELADILKPLQGQPGEYIVNGAEIMTESKYRRAWQRIEKQVNLYEATAHSLRHTFATFAAQYMQPKDLQYIMGHSDISVTMKIYVHVQKDRIPHLWDKVPDMFRVA